MLPGIRRAINAPRLPRRCNIEDYWWVDGSDALSHNCVSSNCRASSNSWTRSAGPTFSAVRRASIAPRLSRRLNIEDYWWVDGSDALSHNRSFAIVEMAKYASRITSK